ncbi:MAG: hypothetical protein GXY85_02425 [Candidatus Brocadiaceae bacterium]|nr:hypothetical protein [Candidatus Brocadiaceae bacterium]
MTAEQPSTTPQPPSTVRIWSRRLRLTTLLVVVVLVLIVMFQNGARQDYHVLFWSTRVSPLLMLLVVFLCGAAAGALAVTLRRRR